MSYTLNHLHWAMARGRASLTVETAAFIVLSAAEQLQSSPRAVDNAAIMLTEAGSVMLAESAPTDPASCDGQLRGLLTRLVAECGGEHPGIDAVVFGRPDSPRTLAAELRAALIPINRGAARRALQRLHRRLEAAGPPLDARVEHASLRPARQETQPGAIADPSPPVVTPAPVLAPAPSFSEMSPPPPPARTDATPFLGSMAVQPIAPTRATPASAGLSSIFAAEPAAETMAVGEVCTSPTESMSVVEASVAPAEQGLTFGRFRSRRSDVGDLVDAFSIETATEAGLVADQLRRCVTEDSGQSCTPLPARVG